MDSIKEITEEDIEEQFAGQIITRGEEYFEEGLVESIEFIDDQSISGVVLGNDKYNVTVSLDSDGEIICDCTCPYDYKCKHAVALLLKWISQKKGDIKEKINLDEETESNIKEESIDKILSDKDKEELIILIKNMLSKNPDLRSLIVIRKNEIVQKIRRLFSGFWEWNQVRGLISELELLLEGIRKSKRLWNKELFDEIEKASSIIRKNYDNIHDEGDLGLFLEDWYEVLGEIFASTNPSNEEKVEFIKRYVLLTEKDDYGMDGCYEKAILGMCMNFGDFELVKQNYKFDENKEDYGDKDYYISFYLDILEKIGEDETYLLFSKDKGFNIERIKKLIELKRYKEALSDCLNQKEFSVDVENLKIQIYRKLKDIPKIKNILFNLSNKTGDISYAKKLKKECDNKEWNDFLNKIIDNARKNNWKEFLSRIYYGEGNYKKAYDYGKDLSKDDYLELLSKKLTDDYPKDTCQILRNLCFKFINHGSGWPYKKAGQLLKQIKKIDDSGSFFKKTKNEIILNHKKKYSLMNIIERI